GFSSSVVQIKIAYAVLTDDPAHVVLTAVPGALVHGLFLTPDHLLQVGVRRHYLGQVVFGERVELLDTDNGNILVLIGTAFFQQIIVDLAAAHDQAIHLGRIDVVDLWNDGLEGTVGQVLQAGNGQLVTQQ